MPTCLNRPVVDRMSPLTRITRIAAVVRVAAISGMAFAVFVVCSPPPARAADLEFSLAGGATQLYVDEGDEDVLNDEWGPWVRPSFSLAPIDAAPQFRLGGAVGFGWVRGTIDDAFLAGDVDLFLITPELLLSWRQPIGGAEARWYVEPGIGVGATIGALWAIGTDWGYGYSVRPFVRAGYQWDNWSAGLEAAYRFGHLDFGDSDGDVENLEIGVFAAWKL